MQRARVSNHPCHRLSVPSAKRFWCRHCMMVFEDAITRWRHSRTCRSGGFDNFVRRREIETQTLQKMAETLDPNMVTQITVPSGNGAGGSKELCCFICRQRFVSLDEMREHVKYPCNKPATLQRSQVPMVFPEPTFGTGIQQHYTEGPSYQTFGQQGSSSAATAGASSAASSSNPQAVTVYMNEGEAPHQMEHSEGEAKPTNIYVNEKGETVIEVENLDLNTKSGELSLAHLLTQLSQQGIVFDQHQQEEGDAEEEIAARQHEGTEVDYSQPTAVDAANTLTQLAESAYRSVSTSQEQAYAPAMEVGVGVSGRQIKAEKVELQYQQVEAEAPAPALPHHHHPQQVQVQTSAYLPKEEPFAGGSAPHEKYIICTNEQEVISVMRANNVAADGAGGRTVFYENGQPQPGDLQTALIESGVAEQTVLFEEGVSQAVNEQDAGTAVVSEEGSDGASMIVLQHQQQADGQPHMLTTTGGQLIKAEVPTSSHMIVTTAIVEQQQHQPPEQEEVVTGGVVSASSSSSYPEVIGEGSVSEGHDLTDSKCCVVVSDGQGTLTSEDAVATVTTSDGAVLQQQVEMVTEQMTTKSDEPTPLLDAVESALLMQQVVSMSSSSTSEQVVLQQPHNAE